MDELEGTVNETKVDSNLAVICAIEILDCLLNKYKGIISSLRSSGISLRLMIVKEDFYYGLIGSSSSFRPAIYGSKLKNSIELLVRVNEFICKDLENFTEIPAVVASDIYNELHQDLQILCLPYEISVKDLFYKIYSFCSNTDVQTELEEFAQLNLEFSTKRILELKEQTAAIVTEDIEMVVDYLYSTNLIAQHANASLKSLTKLAFNYLLESQFTSTLDILEEVLEIMMEEGGFDLDFSIKMKQLKEKVQQISSGGL